MKTKVSLIIGSDSDWPVVKKAYETLNVFGVSCDVRVLSAHRTPDEVRRYVTEEALEIGIEVFIAAAGKAAHLPGVVASYTIKPVIGVPIRSDALNGMDALFSIAQMPSGIPVASTAIDGAENAALLALQILALYDEALVSKLADHRLSMADTVIKKSETLRNGLTRG